MNQYIRIALLGTLVISSESFAQVTFQEAFLSQLTGLSFGIVAWGDYDADGDLDAFFSGYNGTKYEANIYKNTGSGFSKISILSDLSNAICGADWGDFDKDGDLDLALVNPNGASNQYPIIFKNTDGVFSSIYYATSSIATYGSDTDLEWADIDNDGDLDVVVSNYYDNSLLINNDGVFSKLSLGTINSIITQLGNNPSLDVADLNKDGKIDIVVTGRDNKNFVNKTWFFHQGEPYSFSEVFSGQVSGNRSGDTKFGDFNADGYLDVFQAGTQNNTFAGKFDGTKYSTFLLPYYYINQGDWADIDNDGGFEVVGGRDSLRFYDLSGDQFTEILKGQTNTKLKYNAVGGQSLYDIQLGDYDADGDLDILIGGEAQDASDNSINIAKIFQNTSTTKNATPTAPTNLSASIATNGKVTFTWNQATDTETPAVALQYDLYIGTATGKGDKRHPHAILSTGQATLPEQGPIRGTSWFINDLPNGTYYWSVQSVDGGLRRSAFATEGTFTVNVTAPTTPVATVATNVTSTSFTANWTQETNVSKYILELDTATSFSTSSKKELTLREVGSYAFTGLRSGTIYYYRIKALNGGGATAYSNVIRVGQVVTLTGVSSDKGYPGDTLTLTGTGFEEYLPYNVVKFGTVKATVILTNSTRTSLKCIVPSGVQDDVAVSVEVLGNTASLTNTFLLTTLRRPTTLTITKGTNVQVKWAPVSGAASYAVYRGTSLTSMSIQGSVTTTGFSQTTPTTAGLYYYYVRAVDSNSLQSANSDPVSVSIIGTTGTNVSGNLIESETWTVANSPYNVVGDLGVPTGFTLTVQPGVVVVFKGDYRIFVTGTIKIQGEGAAPVVFQGNSVLGTKYQLEIRRTNLANQTLNYLNVTGSQAFLKLGDGSDATQNTGDLTLSGVNIKKSKIDLGGTTTSSGMSTLPTNRLIIKDSYLDSTDIEQLSLASRLSILGTQFKNSKIKHVKVFMDNSVLINSILENTGVTLSNTYEIIDSRFINSAFRTHDLNNDKVTIDGLTSINTLYNIQIPVTIKNSTFLFERSLKVANRLDGYDISKDTAMFYFRMNASFSNPYSLDNCNFLGTTGITAIKWVKSATNNANQTKSIKNSTFRNFDCFISAQEYPLTLTGNNFLEAYKYQIILRNAVSVSAQGNYWNSDTPTTIAQGIYDSGDNLDLGTVDYSNRLSTINLSAPMIAPAGVVKTTVSEGVKVTWSASKSTDVAGYKVYYGGFTGSEFRKVSDVGNVLTHTITGGSLGDVIAISAYDAGADGFQDAIEGFESVHQIAVGPPAAPTNLISTAITTSGFTASWDAVEDATGYRFDLSVASDFSTYVTGNQNRQITTNSLALTGLTPNTTYYWRVRSENAAGVSSSSNAILIGTQLFEEVFADQLVGIGSGDVEWVDLNADSYLDVVVSGFSTQTATRAYTFNGSGFSEIMSGQLAAVGNSDLALGDFDRDGDPDILVSGDNAGTYVTNLYAVNYPNAVNTSTALTAQSGGNGGENADWGDYNNDGSLDLIMSGNTSTGSITSLFINKNGVFQKNTNFSVPGANNGSVEWADIDNDGDLDVFVSVRDSNSKIFRNDHGSFIDVSNDLLPDINNAASTWVDFDLDGDLDLVISGRNFSSVSYTMVYRNDVSTFTQVLSDLFQGVAWGGITAGDYDNDGDPDLMIGGFYDSGNATTVNTAFIYRNDLTTFTKQAFNLPGFYAGDVEFGDFDKDNDLDIILVGDGLSGTRIFKNSITSKNVAPSQISTASATVTGSKVNFTWTAPADDTTPALGLNYNIYIGTAPGKQDVRPAHADVATGFRRVVERGDIQGTSWYIQNLVAGTYYWGIQAIDASFAGGAFSEEQSFTIESNAIPEFSATSLDFGELVNDDQATREFSIKNIGTVDLVISAITYPSGFTGNYTSGTLKSGDIDTVTVTFSPTAAQDYAGRITINSNKTSGPDGIDVAGKGAGTARYEMGYNPTSLDFGSVNIATPSTKSFYLVNKGNKAITFISPSITGSSSTEFSVNNFTNPQLSPNDSVLVQVQFNPANVGAKSATILFSNTIPSSSQIIGSNVPLLLTGFGVDPSIPLAPQNLTASAVQFDRVTLSWDATSQAKTYEVQLATDNQFTSGVISRTGITTTTVEIDGLSEKTTYFTRVRGVNNASVSGPYSTFISFITPPEDPFAPIALAASNIEFRAFDANWNPVSGVVGYYLDVSEDSEFNTFASGYNNLDVENVTTFQVTGLKNGTTYYYRVRSKIENGSSSSSSNVVSVTTVLAPPASPVLGSVSAIQYRQAKLNWEVVSKADGYVLEVAEDEGFSVIKESFTVVNTSLVVDDLTPSTTYFYSLRAYNLAGTGSSVKSSFTTLQDVVAPTMVINSTLSEVLPSNLTVSAVATDDDRLAQVNFYKSPALASSWSKTETTDITTSFVGYITASDFDEIGVSYFFEAIDASGNFGFSDTLTIRALFPPSIEVVVPELSTGTDVTDYQLFAFPFQSASVATVLSDLGDAKNTNWRLFRYLNGYSEYPSFANLDPGVGYWLIVDQNLSSISLNGTLNPVASSVSNPFSVTLTSGWNLIGNPYPSSISWSEVVASSGFSSGDISSLIVWDNGYQTSSTLDAFEGGFVFANQSNLTLRFPISAISGSRLADQQGVARESLVREGGWEVVLDIEAGGMRYSAGGFGVHPQASLTRDGYDVPELIHFNKFLKLTDEWGLSTSIQPQLALNTWTLFVERNTKTSTLASLNFHSTDLPNGLRVVLIDSENQEVIEVGDGRPYHFNLKGSHAFIAVSGDEKAVADYLNSRGGYIGDVFPNPTSGIVRVNLHTINTQSESEVSFELVDLAGRVLEIQKQHVTGGAQTLTFNPKTLPMAGVYFLNISLSSEEGIIEKKVKLYYE